MPKLFRIIGTLLSLYFLSQSLTNCFNGLRPTWFVILNLLSFLVFVYILIDLVFSPTPKELKVTSERIYFGNGAFVNWSEITEINYIEEDLKFKDGELKLSKRLDKLNLFEKIFKRRSI